MRELLLIGAGYMGTSYVAAARSLGVSVTLIETELHRARLEGEVDRFVLARGTSEEDWAAAALGVATSIQPDGVLGFAELQVVAAALIQDRLNVPGPSLRAAVISRNKLLQRGCFQAAGLRQPDHLLARDAESTLDWARTRFPLVVKPLTLSGSAGVIQVTDESGLADALDERLPVEKVLVEQYLSGAEYSWEGLIKEGAVIFGNVTAKETTGPPEFVELAHRGAHRLASADRRAVDTLATGVVKAMGMRTGIVHLEFKFTPTGPAIIEVAVRTPGDYIMDILALSYDFDPYRVMVAMALNLPIDEPLPVEPRAIGASWFPRSAAGRVAGIRGVADLSRHPHVKQVQLRLAPGDTINPLVSSAQRLGHVLFRAPDPTSLERAMTWACSALVVDLETAPPSPPLGAAPFEPTGVLAPL